MLETYFDSCHENKHKRIQKEFFILLKFHFPMNFSFSFVCNVKEITLPLLIPWQTFLASILIAICNLLVEFSHVNVVFSDS